MDASFRGSPSEFLWSFSPQTQGQWFNQYALFLIMFPLHPRSLQLCGSRPCLPGYRECKKMQFAIMKQYIRWSYAANLWKLLPAVHALLVTNCPVVCSSFNPFDFSIWKVKTLILEILWSVPRQDKNCHNGMGLGRTIPFLHAKNISFTFWSFKYWNNVTKFMYCKYSNNPSSSSREKGWDFPWNAVSHRVGNLIDIWPDED